MNLSLIVHLEFHVKVAVDVDMVGLAVRVIWDVFDFFRHGI